MREKENSKMKGAVWFHAASVGEFEQARPIIEKLRAERPEEKILLTFFSPSGYELRKNYDQVDKVMYLPFATKKRVRMFLDTFQPKMAVFIKYEFWPAYLKEIHKRGIPLYSVSAIFRPGQLFFQPWGRWYLNLLKNFDGIFVQDDDSRQLLEKHGITNVTVSGDTRFDRVSAIAEQAKEVAFVRDFVRGGRVGESEAPIVENGDDDAVRSRRRVIVAGSTWPKDEVLLAKYVATHKDVKLVLVPHEIDDKHLHYIFNLFEGRMMRYSEEKQYVETGIRTLVIDTVGMLSSLYRYGQVAYIGGGFGVGIHNTIEAAVYGVPVIFGPNYQRFREARNILSTGAGESVRDYKGFEAAVDRAFAEHETMGAKALEYVRSELGATENVYKAILMG